MEEQPPPPSLGYTSADLIAVRESGWQRIINTARRFGWLFAIVAVIYLVWINTQASDPDAAGRVEGQIFFYILAGYAVVWFIGRTRNRPALRGWWPWTVVLTAVVMLALVLIPIGNPRDRTVASYLTESSGYAYTVNEEAQAAFEAALADQPFFASNVEEAKLFEVRRDGEIVGALQIQAIRPEAIGASDDVWDGVRSALSKQETNAVDIEIAGEAAVAFELSGGHVVFWHVDNLAVAIFAEDDPTARAISEALRAANAE